MPEGNNGWQDWTAEGYAETDEWQRYIDEQKAISEEQQRTHPAFGRVNEEMIRKLNASWERMRTSGPSATQLSGINRQGRAAWESSPQRALEEYGELGDVPDVAAPSMEMLRRYQLGAMDVPARGAAIQAGAASQRLGGLNPSARAQALSEISRGGAGMVGAGGGGGGGGGAMAQQAALASYQGQMQNRGMLGNAIQQSLGQGYAMSQISQQHRNAQEMLRMQQEMQRRQQQRSGGFWGAMGGIAGTALGGPFGGWLGGVAGTALGGKLFGGGGGGRGQYDYSPPMGGQQNQYASPGYGW